MSDEDPILPPTRLEKVVDVLVKFVLAVWAVALVVLVVNSLAIHHHAASLIGVRLLLLGMLVALATVITILGSALINRRRGRRSSD